MSRGEVSDGVARGGGAVCGRVLRGDQDPPHGEV